MRNAALKCTRAKREKETETHKVNTGVILGGCHAHHGSTTERDEPRKKQEREVQRKMDIERAKKSRPCTDYLKKATHGGYICPECGSGAHKNGSGALHYYPATNTCYCFVCGSSFDVIDLARRETDGSLQETISSLTGEPVSTESARKEKTRKPAITNPQTRTGSESEKAPRDQIDYTEFYKAAAANITSPAAAAYLKQRGLNTETTQKHMIGFVPDFQSPKALREGANPPASPRLIIPVTSSSFVARATDNNQIRYMNEGSSGIFNHEALERGGVVFVTEGAIDSMSIEQVMPAAAAIATNSTSGYNGLLSLMEKRSESAPPVHFVLVPDTDENGKAAAAALAKGLDNIGISHSELNIAAPHKDSNEWLLADKESFKKAVEAAAAEGQRELEAAESQLKADIEGESIAAYLPDFIAELDTMRAARPIPTGIAPLDNLIDGGLYAGLYFVGAVSSLGKTTLALQIADNIAAAGHDVIVFSLEMARGELIAKSLSRLSFLIGNRATGKSTRGILRGDINPAEKETFTAARDRYAAAAPHLFVYEGIGNIGYEQIREKVKRHKRVMGTNPVVIIDYLQILAPTDIRATDKQNTDKAVLELKRISRDYSVPIIGISSFNRDNYTSPVNLASFKESGAIEYSSDVLIGLQYAGMDYQQGETDGQRQKRIRDLMQQMAARASRAEAQTIDLKVLKNRNGSKGACELFFYPAFNTFTEEAPFLSDTGNESPFNLPPIKK